MGLFQRVKNAQDIQKHRPVDLRLSLPTRVRVPITAGEPSLLVHVVDPALVLGDTWARVVQLRKAATDREVAAECDPASITEMLLESIGDDPMFDSARPLLDAPFVESWVSAGYSLAAAEAAAGLSPAPGGLSSTVSAAMTSATLELGDAGLTVAAQCVLRDSYIAARMRQQGSSTAHLDLSTYLPDFRLALIRQPWHIAHEMIEGWVSRMPLPSTVRNPWLNMLAKAADDGDRSFANAVIEANQKLCALADKMSGHGSALVEADVAEFVDRE